MGSLCETLVPVDEQPANVIPHGFQFDDSLFDFVQALRGERPGLPARRRAVLSLLEK